MTEMDWAGSVVRGISKARCFLTKATEQLCRSGTSGIKPRRRADDGTLPRPSGLLFGCVLDRVLHVLAGLFDRIFGVFGSIADFLARPAVEGIVDRIFGFFNRSLFFARRQRQQGRDHQEEF